MPCYRTIEGVDVRGKRVLVRVDHNIDVDPSGKLKNDEKIRMTLPTINFLLKKNARIILMCHRGRPKGKPDSRYSTALLAKHLQQLLPGVPVKHVSSTVGPRVEKEVAKLKNGHILYLENVRFSPNEEGSPSQQKSYGKQLAALADIYVNEAFPSLHTYEEASTCAVARFLPSYAGFHLLKEIEHLSQVTERPKHPLTLIISGAKIETKIPVIENFLRKSDHILLGGCIANTFIAARGFSIGKSKYEEDAINQAQELMLESEKKGRAKIHVPRDGVVASELSEKAVRLDLPDEDIEGDMSIFDIGAVSTKRYCDVIARSKMIIWNGPVGVYETKGFERASKAIAEAVREASRRGSVTIIGGGDTLDFHKRYKISMKDYTFVSMGGGAMLEYLSGKEFQSLKALQKK